MENTVVENRNCLRGSTLYLTSQWRQVELLELVLT